jgi:ribosome-associated heat shock protein Hsp15
MNFVFMRVDKFLWSVRLFKTRSIAGEQVRNNKVVIDEVTVKPSREVKIGDVVVVKRHGFEQHIEVLAYPKNRVGAKLVSEYMKDVTPHAELEKQEFLQMARNMTRIKGLGRPTKKDRRDLDDLFES